MLKNQRQFYDDKELKHNENFIKINRRKHVQEKIQVYVEKVQ